MPSVRHLPVADIRPRERIRPEKRARLDERRSCSHSARLGSAPFGSLRLSGPRPRGFLALSLSLSLSLIHPGKMVGLSRLAGGGLLLLLLALLPLALDGKPAPLPQALPEAPAGGVMASVTEEQQRLPAAEESPGPAAGRSGSKVAKLGSGCFGIRLDHIGTSSGMGCNWPVQNRPKPTPAGS